MRSDDFGSTTRDPPRITRSFIRATREKTMRGRIVGFAMACGLLSLLAAGAVRAQTIELTFWSHWAAEMPKREFVEGVIKDFEAKHPNVKIKPTWYEKTALYAALKTAL